MRKKIFIYICLILVGFFSYSFGQTLPDPIRYYPLNNLSAVDVVAGRNGTINGAVTNFTDRFGVTGGAMSFGDNTHISTPDFFAGSNYTNGFTISFWTFIDQNISKNQGTRPWDDNDPAFQAFYARSGSALVNNTLLGFQRIRDRAVINRYTIDQNNDKKDWGVWLWDPVNFTNRIGWYQIVLVYERAKMTTYVFYPNGQSESMSHYFRLQELTNVDSWGLGNINAGNSFPFRVLDDFKVFAQPLTREQVRVLYSREAVPGGMYRVSYAANESRFIHTLGRNMNPGARLELYTPDAELTAPFQWVFEPVPGQQNVFRIRMAYTDNSYIHLVNRSSTARARVEIWGYEANFARFYEWYLEPVGNGFFHIRSNANRNMYLHTFLRSSDNSTALEIYDYNSTFDQFYRWRLNLVKTQFELNGASLNNTGQLIVPSFNTFLENQPQNANVANTSQIRIGRESFPNPSFSNWILRKSTDDSYLVQNNNINDRFWHPTARNVTNNNSVQVLEWYINNPNVYRWIFDRDVINRFGRRYQVRPALNQNLSLQPDASAPLRQNSNLFIRQIQASSTDELSWQLFPFRTTPPVNKQVYRIEPGVYRISSQANPSLFIATQSFSFNNSARLSIQSFSEERFTSFYWDIDFEKDAQGNPVRDGAYLIKFFGTDNRFIHTVNNSLSNSAELEIYGLNPVHMGTYKMFIEPVGSGNYRLRIAGNKDLYMHLWNNQASANTIVEVYPFDSRFVNTYGWRFERINIEAPLAAGTYRLALAGANNPQRFLHTIGRSNNDGARLEILSFEQSFAAHYSWIFELQPDNTYTIRRSNVGNRYVHPIGRSVSDGTRLQILSYSANHARLYKWILVRGTTPNSFRLRLVDFPGRLMHTSGHSTGQSAEVEILNFNQSFLQTYEWIPITP